MKFIHLSDLHLGKKVKNFSLIEDQEAVLHDIAEAVRTEKPQAVCIAGDIYDKGVPTEEAVRLLDGFLTELSALTEAVLIISGNHDSAERLSYGRRIFSQKGLYFAPVYSAKTERVELTDSFGTVVFHLLPFVKPCQVRAAFPDKTIDGWDDAVRAALDSMEIDRSRRNVLLAHQFVTGGERSESETLCVGDADNVDAALFGDFDYVALGHLHRSQAIDSAGRIRYCGTPLPYSFSEGSEAKSVTVVELGAKEAGSALSPFSVRRLPLTPKRRWVSLKGPYETLIQKSYKEAQGVGETDWVRITLTDEEDIFDAFQKLRTVYPGLMQFDFDNTRTRQGFRMIDGAEIPQTLSPFCLFTQLYERQNGRPPEPEAADFLRKQIQDIWG